MFGFSLLSSICQYPSSYLSLSFILSFLPRSTAWSCSVQEGFHSNAHRHAAGHRVTRDSVLLAAIGCPVALLGSDWLAWPSGLMVFTEMKI